MADGSARPAAEWVAWPTPGARPTRDPMLPSGYRVADKRQELADTWTLSLEPADGAGGGGVGDFKPGQFGMLYAFGTGEVPVSVSRIGAGGTLVHTVRAVGAATRAICAAEPGQQLGVRGPFGSAWPLAAASGRDVAIVGGGLGLAPLRPAIDQLAANRGDYGAVTLLYGARSPAEMLYDEEVDAWRERGISVHSIVDYATAGWRGRVGPVTKLLPDAELEPRRSTALVCGPEVMMRFVAAALVERGLDREHVHLSLERNMKCAIGHCGHCQLAHRFVCRDGPVFPLSMVEPLIGVPEL